MERSFTIEQIPVYVKAGAIVPMQPPMLHTGEKAGRSADCECVAAGGRIELELFGV